MSLITNTPKKKLGDYTIEELESFPIEQLDGIAIDRQFTPITNTSKVSFAELWSTIETTWAQELRTWLDLSSLISNTSFRNLGSYTMEELAGFTPEQLANISFGRQFSPITNTQKPA